MRAAVGWIDPERVLALLDGLVEAAEGSERGGAVAPASGIARAYDERAVVEPERLLEAALLVLLVAGPRGLLRVGGRHGRSRGRRGGAARCRSWRLGGKVAASVPLLSCSAAALPSSFTLGTELNKQGKGQRKL
jgi:hypothetical protein